MSKDMLFNPLKGAKFGYAQLYWESGGDVWECVWADDGNLYSVSDDTNGFTGNTACFNLVFNKIEGDDPRQLQGTTVNLMEEYGTAGQLGEDGCCWKALGTICVDGVLYATVARHNYGGNSKDPFNRQTSFNASIIKSYDYGKTWVRSSEENYKNPTFPGKRFGAPCFIKYGIDGKANTHNADQYVYAVSNNGFWDNGDNMVLGRVLKTKLGSLEGTDWEFYRGGEGMLDSNWSKDMDEAVFIIDNSGKCSMTGAQYIEPLGRYLMIQWYYTAGGGQNFSSLDTLMLENPGEETGWDLYESPTPWGPWTKFITKRFCPMGYYNPCIVPKFISEDGKDIVIFTNGNFHVPALPDKSYSMYRLCVMKCHLDT